MKRVEFSLPDALDLKTVNLPTSLTTSQKCLLNGGFVFEAGFKFIVLQRQCVKLLFGMDWHGKMFRLNTILLADLYVDVVNEIHPENLKEIREFLPSISYLLCKATKNIEFFRFDKNETFEDLNRIALITNCGQTIYQSLESLLNKERFVFVNCKKTVFFKDLLSNDILEGTIIRFINGFDCQIPTGNFVIKGVYMYDSILTVSKIGGNHNKHHYQIFQVDSGIKVFISKDPLPMEVINFGSYGSDGYLYKIKEIMFYIHYDIYSPLFYGQFITDISFEKEIKENKENTERVTVGVTDLAFINGLLKKTEDSIESKVFRSTSSFEQSKSNVERPRSNSEQPRLNVERPTSLFLPLIDNNPLTKQSFCSSSLESEKLSPLNNYLELSDDLNNMTKGQNELRERAIQRKKLCESKSLKFYNIKSQRKSNIPATCSPTERCTETPFYDKKNFENNSLLENAPQLSPSALYAPHPLKLSKSFDGNILRYSARTNNYTINNYKKSVDRSLDSGIDSPDTNDGFEKAFASPINNITSLIGQINESNADEIEENMTIKHSKSDTYIYEEMRAAVKNSDNSVNISRSTEIVCSDYMSIDYSSVKPRRFSTLTQKKEIESLEEIYSCSIDDIVNRLHLLQLSKFVKKFRKQLINGRLLGNLSEDALIEIGLTHFEARKLYKYVHGWRVNTINCSENLENALVTSWSVNDVRLIMAKIKLHRLGMFAAENQVDGALLEDLIKNNYIKTLENDHGIRLTIVETERLRGYVFKEVKYNDYEIMTI